MLNLGIEQPLHATVRDTVTIRILNRHSTLLCHSWLNYLLGCHVNP